MTAGDSTKLNAEAFKPRVLAIAKGRNWSVLTIDCASFELA